MQVLALGNNQKKITKDESGQELMLHSLNSVNYLKTHPTNCVQFDFSDSDKKVITVQQQYDRLKGESEEETKFDSVYKLQIH